MSRWTELGGKYVDLDEVRAIQLVDDDRYSFGTAIILTVPGGTVDVPLNEPGTTDLPYPPYPALTYPPRPHWWSSRATRDAWEAFAAERKRAEDEYDRAKRAYGDAIEASRRRKVQERFDALVCEIGARDCGEDSTGG